jgi:DNA polymerase III delta subunit
VPRPKSELTNSGRVVGIRLTEWEFQEWKKLGAQKWLREQLKGSKLKAAPSLNSYLREMLGTPLKK